MKTYGNTGRAVTNSTGPCLDVAPRGWAVPPTVAVLVGTTQVEVLVEDPDDIDRALSTELAAIPTPRGPEPDRPALLDLLARPDTWRYIRGHATHLRDTEHRPGDAAYSLLDRLTVICGDILTYDTGRTP